MGLLDLIGKLKELIEKALGLCRDYQEEIEELRKRVDMLEKEIEEASKAVQELIDLVNKWLEEALSLGSPREDTRAQR